MANINTEYEQLVAQIHQGILNSEGFDNLRVEHNVVIRGKSGTTHQIDVFWEFKIAGTIYRTCIECKNYSTSSVKKLHVAAFAETLRDIGNANGIIATTSSFQKGAKLLAEHNNIRLVLVNYLIQSIHLKIQPIVPNFSNVQLNFNNESKREALKRKNLNSYEKNLTFSGEQKLMNELNEPIETLNSILNKHAKKEGNNTISNINLYISFEDLGMIMLDSISFDLSYSKSPIMESIIESPHTAKAVIKDIVDENVHYLHNNGTVTTEPN